MCEEEKTGFWNYSDKELIDELSRFSGEVITYTPRTRTDGAICEALRRILLYISNQK
jgi:hypothetical protein